ncbi:MAG: group III truncated hemoglobin [Pseudomonadota bacterium]
MKRDVSGDEDLEFLLRRFYSSVLSDPIIGFIFTDVAKLDLEEHLPSVVQFWSKLLFADTRYQGDVYGVHAELDEKVSLKPGHFTRWLYLFDKAMSESEFAGERASQMSRLAHTMAKSMSAGLAGRKRVDLQLSLNDLINE